MTPDERLRLIQRIASAKDRIAGNSVFELSCDENRYTFSADTDVASTQQTSGFCPFSSSGRYYVLRQWWRDQAWSRRRTFVVDLDDGGATLVKPEATERSVNEEFCWSPYGDRYTWLNGTELELREADGEVVQALSLPDRIDGRMVQWRSGHASGSLIQYVTAQNRRVDGMYWYIQPFILRPFGLLDGFWFADATDRAGMRPDEVRAGGDGLLITLPMDPGIWYLLTWEGQLRPLSNRRFSLALPSITSSYVLFSATREPTAYRVYDLDTERWRDGLSRAHITTMLGDQFGRTPSVAVTSLALRRQTVLAAVQITGRSGTAQQAAVIQADVRSPDRGELIGILPTVASDPKLAVSLDQTGQLWSFRSNQRETIVVPSVVWAERLSTG